jgi:HPt (histidine-containing phosphotransfer) domain-containing protein
MSHVADSREPVLDDRVFHDLHESLVQPAAVAALYRKFAGNAAAFIGELRSQENHARIDTLHTLKGSAAMMGATRIAKLATHLQAQLQCSSVQMAPAIEELAGELASFRSVVAARLLELGASLEL